MTRTKAVLPVLALSLSLSGSAVLAAGSGVTIPEQAWSFDPPFGSYDRAAAQRGLQVYLEVCASCHSLSYVSYRSLGALGFSEEQIKAIAAASEVEDGPDETGDMFMRPGLPRDFFVSPFPNPESAAASLGAIPPDLSLITRARPHGPDYLYALLAGYADPPDDVDMADGMSYNPYFGSGQIAMAPPLAEDIVTYGDGTPATVPQMARDVTVFLSWAADPHREARHSTGFAVIGFLLFLGGLLCAIKRRVWSRLH